MRRCWRAPTRTPAVSLVAVDIVQILPAARTGAEGTTEGVGRRRPVRSVRGGGRSAAYGRGEVLLVVILEDLDAADQLSLLLLQFVAAGAGDHAMVILGTYRDVELLLHDPLIDGAAQVDDTPAHRYPAAGTCRSPECRRSIQLISLCCTCP